MVFIVFAELWVTFLQTCAELRVQIFNQMAHPRPKLGSVTPPRLRALSDESAPSYFHNHF